MHIIPVMKRKDSALFHLAGEILLMDITVRSNISWNEELLYTKKTYRITLTLGL